ncbi:MAG TPA: DUF1345 domain-containing protein [Burkholderiaceae bacterium]|nr:DUF1345 domain-containing protein [Burkholderiaceae bacterium]
MHKYWILRQIRARPRLLASAVVGILILVLVSPAFIDQHVTRALIAWNSGTVLYIVLISAMMVRSSREGMQRRAQSEDEGQYVVLGLVVLAVIASLAAIAGELAVAKDLHGGAKTAHVALAAVTVLSSWAFMHLTFALHYAHDFYAAVALGREPGLEFPGKDEPGYGDFFYFAAIIGTSGQTADVAFTRSALRRLGSAHCIIAFFFNTAVLALAINIAASALSG